MSINRTLFLAPLAVISFALIFASTVRADTITFDSLETPGFGVTFVNSYTEAGYTFTCGSTFLVLHQNRGDYAGSAALLLDGIGDSARLSHGGTGFSLQSIDLSVGFFQEPITVTFIGHFLGGGTTEQSFTFSQFGFRTFSFNPTFTNLDYVDFGPNFAPYFQFDNVVVSSQTEPVPEPATMLLLGTGLVGLVAAVRKRDQHSS